MKNSQEEIFDKLGQVKKIDINKTTLLLEIDKLYQQN